MNIVQLHHKTMFYMDSVRSPRFPYKTVDKALQASITKIVKDRYDSMNKAERNEAFQISQRLRDELYTLVEEGTVSASGDLYDISSTYSDYWLLASMKVLISGTEYNTIPLTYDEENVIENNPFGRPTLTYPSRVYRNESSSGVRIKYGEIGVPGNATIYYIKEPASVALGTVVQSGNVDHGQQLICYLDGTVNTYTAGGSLISTTDYEEGDELTVSSSGGYGTVISGIFVKDWTNCDLPSILHEEVCKEAAKILSGTVENYERVRDLQERPQGQ